MKAKASNSTALDVPVIPPGAPVIFRLAAHCAGPGRGLWMRCHVCRVVLGDEDGRSVPTHTAVREHWAAVHPVELEGLRDRPAAVTAPKVVAKPAHESAVCAAEGCGAVFDSGSRGTARYCSARCKNATSNAALAARRRAATAGEQVECATPGCTVTWTAGQQGHGRRRFCSTACRTRTQRTEAGMDTTGGRDTCEQCDADLIQPATGRRRRFCGPMCQDRARRARAS